MEIETLKEKVNEEVQAKATVLAVAKVRELTLAKRRAENVVKTVQEEIVELDKEIAEVKVEDFVGDALEVVAMEEVEKRVEEAGNVKALASHHMLRRMLSRM